MKKKKQDVFERLASAQKRKDAAKKKKTLAPESMIAYILATMRYKPSTIMFVRVLSKNLNAGRKLSTDQRKALTNIYKEWIGGRAKILNGRIKKEGKKK